MAAETNLIKTSDIKTREMLAVETYTSSVDKLREILGVTRMMKVSAGFTAYILKVKGSLVNDGKVGEGELIPLSPYTVEKVDYGKIDLRKYRQAVSGEAIQQYGRDVAIVRAQSAMVRDAQKVIRDTMFSAFGSGTTTSGVGLQDTLAHNNAKLNELYENIGGVSGYVHFCNYKDMADYLGKAQITTQTEFGMTYVVDFLGLGTLIGTASVPVGKVHSTALDNIICYYADATDPNGIGGSFNLTTDELGLVGIIEQPVANTFTVDTVMVSGVTFLPEYADGVVTGTINAASV